MQNPTLNYVLAALKAARFLKPLWLWIVLSSFAFCGIKVQAADPNVVNAMVVYSSAARTAFGAGIDGAIDTAIGRVNNIFANSGIPTRLNVVYKGTISYTETDDLPSSLNRLMNKGDGFSDEIFSLRQSVQADIIMVLVQRGTFSGYAAIMHTPHLGFRNKAISITRVDKLSEVEPTTLAHELSHNFGCNHDRSNALLTGAYSYSYAHNVPGPDGVLYGTICSFQPQLIPYFGNPLVSWNGRPTGVAEGSATAADNARTINMSTPIVTQFRSPPPPAPANDNFASRTPITSLSANLVVNTESATREGGEPSHSMTGNDYTSVWWTWTAPSAGEVRIDTFGSDYNTYLAVYTGTAFGALTRVVGNDNTAGGPYFSQSASQVAFIAEAGRTYQIAGAGMEYDSGNFNLNFAFSPYGTGPANNITKNSARLNGLIPGGQGVTNVWFEWGLTTGYGNITPRTTVTPSGGSTPFSQTISNLTPGATYHFRLVTASGGSNTVWGDMEFTMPSPPTVTTSSNVLVNVDGVSLSGTSNPRGDFTAVWFQYGFTTAYGSVSPVTFIGNGTNVVNVTTSVGNLAPGAIYHFRAVASNSLGTVTGADFSFSLPSTPDWALKFDGTNDYVNVPDAPALRMTQPFTVEAWIRRDRTGVQQAIMEKYGCSSSSGGFAFRISPEDKLILWTLDDCNDGRNVTGATSLGANIWYHVAGLWDGTQIRVYINGVLDGMASSTRAPLIGTTPLRIGGRGNDAGTTFSGIMDEIRIWNVARTDAQIQGNMARRVGGGESGLAGYWRLDEGAGTRANDVTLAATHGTLVNGPVWVDTTAPLSSRPNVVTDVALNITGTGATLTGTVNPKGDPTSAYFEYGTTTNYTSRTASFAVDNDFAPHNVSRVIGGLSAATTYFYRLAAYNSLGTNFGADLTFTTPFPPSVLTSAATGITGTAATLNGTVNPNSSATTVYYEWGPTPSLGSKTAVQNIGNGNSALPVSQALSGLTPGTTYYFRVAAYNLAGTNVDGILNFTTPGPPAVVTQPPGTFTINSAEFRGTVNPNGGATAWNFEWGTTTAYGNTTPVQNLAAGYGIVNVSAVVSGLASGVTYHYRLVASNSAGSNADGNQTFTMPKSPVAVTQPATGIGGNSATLNASIIANGPGTFAWFQWGADTNYGQTLGFINAGASTNPIVISSNLSSLLPGSTYHFRAVASNSVGVVFGANRSFTLPMGAGTAILFDGINDYVSVSNSPSVAITGNLTIEAWIRRSEIGVQHSIVEKYGCSGPSGGYAFRVGADNRLVFYTLDDCNRGVPVTGASSLTSNVWYHVAAIYNGSTIRVYVNGVLDGSAPNTRAPLIGSTPLKIGARGNDNGTVFKGVLDEVRLWNIARTPADLTATMNRRLTGTESGLAGYWRFDEGSGLLANDASPNRNLATLVNGATWTGLTAPLTGNLQVVTDPPVNVTSTSASLRGAVNDFGEAATAYFEWGTSVLYGNELPPHSIPETTTNYPVARALTGLTPGTLYYVRLVAYNESSGTNYGADVTFFTPDAPDATTQPATVTSANAATFNGLVDPNADETTVYFEWGATTALGNRTANQTIPAGFDPVPVSATFGAFVQGTTYYFRVVAYNSSGTNFGARLSFQTPLKPDATTLAATGVNGVGATIRGRVNPNGGATSVYFQWGTTTSYDFQTAPQTISGSVDIVVTSAISGLAPDTTYHFRVVAENPAGNAQGADMTFTTPSTPSVTTQPATSVRGRDARLNGLVNPGGDATIAWFQWSADGSFANATAPVNVGAGTANVTTSIVISNLTLGTAYQYRLVASNSAGLTVGNTVNFTTMSAPIAVTTAATNISSSAAALTGTVNPNGGAAVAFFQFGLTTNYDNVTPAQNIPAGSSPVGLGQNINSLASATAYHYRLVASNEFGASFGQDQLFFTRPNGSGSALLFDGVDDYVNVPDDPSVRIGALFTVEAWIQRDAMGVQHSIAEKYGCGANGGGFAFRVGDNNRLVLWVLNDCTSGLAASGSTTILSNTWYHVVGLFDGIAIRIYVNGVLDGFTATTTPPAAGTTPLRIGARGNDVGTPFAGIIDEVRFWRVARTPAEIATMMNEPLNGNEPGLAGYWRFDEGSGLAATDSSMNDNVAALVNGPTWISSAAGGASLVVTTELASNIRPRAATLNGTINPGGEASTVFFQWGTSTAYGNSTPVQAIAAGTEAVPVTHNLTGLALGTRYFYRIVGYNETAGTNFGTAQTFITPSAPAATTLPATNLTGTAATLQATVDPNNAATTVFFQWGTTTGLGNNTAGQIVPLGSDPVNVTQALSGLTAGTRYYFRVAATNVAGTNFGAILNFDSPILPLATTQPATQITNTTATLNASVNPRGFPASVWFEWGFTTSYGNVTPIQSAGSGNTLLALEEQISGLLGGATYNFRVVASNQFGVSLGANRQFTTPSGGGGAIRFDGVNDYLNVPDSASLHITGAITVEAWVKRSRTGVQHSILEKYACPGTAASVGGFAFRIGADDKLILYTLNDCNSGVPAVGGRVLATNTWYHVAGVFDGAQIRVYVNGVLDGATFTANNPKLGLSPLRIGARGNDVATPFEGDLDEVRVWNVARTVSQIQTAMNQNLLGSETGLVGYWRFNEGSGLIAGDATANANNATLVNGPLWVSSSAAIGGSETDPELAASQFTEANNQPPVESKPSLNIKPGDAAGEMILELLGEANRTYLVEVSTDLASWSPVALMSSETGVSQARVIPQPGARQFYRARLSE